MKTLQISSVSLAFGDAQILKNATITLTTESRAALAGGNGSGKTTLMKIMAGIASADSGTLSKTPGTRISYLPQSGREFFGKTLHQEAETAFTELHSLLEEKHLVGEKLEHSTEYNKETEELINRQHEIEERLLDSGYYVRHTEIDRVLTGLGFLRTDFQKDCEAFSGGWQMRIALAKVLLEHPDILLLDEPTNYLDYEARSWLEEFLSSYHGGYLIVSHDRYFLDVTVNEVYELFMGEVHRYTGNYSSYRLKRSREMEELKKRYEEQQEEIARTEAFIHKFRYNASKASQVQSRVKYLEKIEPIELPDNMKTIRFSFPPAPHSGKKVLAAENISKTYGEHTVLKDVSLELRRGDKLVVTGVNGAGKSTLLRILAGRDTDFTGSVTLGTGVKTGYFSQEQREFEKSSASVIDTIERDTPIDRIPEIRSLLGAFLFRGDAVYKATHVLSGGEMSRLALLRLLLKPHNLLVLDEPTNHLDIHSKDVLLEALSGFTGSLIFVSHDRYFIEQLATRVLELGENGPKEYTGDFSYYLYRKKKEEEEWTEDKGAEVKNTEVKAAKVQDGRVRGAQKAESSSETQPPAPRSRQTKTDYTENKQRKNRLRSLHKSEEELLEQIEKLETDHKELQTRLAEPEVYSDGEKTREVQGKLKSKENELEELSHRWEDLESEKNRIEEEMYEY